MDNRKQYYKGGDRIRVIRKKITNLSILSQVVLMAKDSCCGSRHVIC